MKMRMQGLVALAALGLNFAATTAVAQDAATGAVDIEASEMEILETDKRAIFRGDVVAKRPTDTIRCQEMIVNYIDVKQADGSASTEVDTLDCKTSVTITTPTQTITGDLAVFQVRKDVLDVTGNVKVVQGKTVLRGPRLNVNLKTKYTKMTGGRVKGRFVPK
jgi:lipopolysaccharide export system protein LptA